MSHLPNEDKTPEIVDYLKKFGYDVAITPSQVVFKKGKTFTFDFESKHLSILKKVPWKVNKVYPFSEFQSFELISDEKIADASPFHDGYKEYYHSVKLNLTTGKSVNLFTLIDRDPESEKSMSVILEYLKRLF